MEHQDQNKNRNQRSGNNRNNYANRRQANNRIDPSTLTPEERRRYIARKRRLAERRKRRRIYLHVRRAVVLLGLFIALILIILLLKTVFGAIGSFLFGSSKSKTAVESSVSVSSTNPLEAQRKAYKEQYKDVDISDVIVNKYTLSDSAVKSSITISNAGDCTLGTDENFDPTTAFTTYYDENGPEYFFEGVKDVFDADDITAVNLEGTFTTSTSRQDKTYAFKGDPEYAEILTDGSIEEVNVANNHSHDYGDQSYTDTQTALEDNDIASSGYNQVSILSVDGINVGFCGFDKISENQDVFGDLEADIAALRVNEADIVIVNYHWGTEHVYEVTDEQVSLAHEAIDQGADLVIGCHPHVLQGYEEYNGKYIAYSLGNFCFGGNKNPDDKETMIFQVTFNVEDGKIAASTESDLNIIPCKLSSTDDYNDYHPIVLEGTEADTVLQHLDEYNALIPDASGTTSDDSDTELDDSEDTDSDYDTDTDSDTDYDTDTDSDYDTDTDSETDL